MIAVMAPKSFLRRWGAATLQTARGELKSSIKALLLVAPAGLLVELANYASVPLHYVHIWLIILLPIILTIVRWGMVAAVVSAMAGKAMMAYWFYPPGFSLESMLGEDLSDARLFANVATLAILLAGLLRQQFQASRRREAEMRQLYVFSRRLVGANSAGEIFAVIQSHLASILGRPVVLLSTEAATMTAIPEDAELPASVQRRAAQIMQETSGNSDRLCEDRADTGWLVRRVSARTAAFGAIAIDVGDKSNASIEKIGRQIAGTLEDAAEALELLDIDQTIRDKSIRAEADRLRDAMIGAASHDLATPLASILCSATVLSSMATVTRDARACALVDDIRTQAERHGKDIEDLLDAGRINGKAVVPRYQWTDVTDVINAAVERLSYRRSGREVQFHIQQELPLVHVDPLLLERALLQVLDNAAKYSDPSARIEVATAFDSERLILTVRDGGGGLTEGEKTQIWRRYFRSERHAETIAGSGLGLWIAQAFVAANGGFIEADSPGPGGGTTMSIVLPLATLAAGEIAPAGIEGEEFD